MNMLASLKSLLFAPAATAGAVSIVPGESAPDFTALLNGVEGGTEAVPVAKMQAVVAPSAPVPLDMAPVTGESDVPDLLPRPDTAAFLGHVARRGQVVLPADEAPQPGDVALQAAETPTTVYTQAPNSMPVEVKDGLVPDSMPLADDIPPVDERPVVAAEAAAISDDTPPVADALPVEGPPIAAVVAAIPDMPVPDNAPPMDDAPAVDSKPVAVAAAPIADTPVPNRASLPDDPAPVDGKPVAPDAAAVTDAPVPDSPAIATGGTAPDAAPVAMEVPVTDRAPAVNGLPPVDDAAPVAPQPQVATGLAVAPVPAAIVDAIPATPETASPAPLPLPHPQPRTDRPASAVHADLPLSIPAAPVIVAEEDAPEVATDEGRDDADVDGPVPVEPAPVPTPPLHLTPPPAAPLAPVASVPMPHATPSVPDDDVTVARGTQPLHSASPMPVAPEAAISSDIASLAPAPVSQAAIPEGPVISAAANPVAVPVAQARVEQAPDPLPVDSGMEQIMPSAFPRRPAMPVEAPASSAVPVEDRGAPPQDGTVTSMPVDPVEIPAATGGAADMVDPAPVRAEALSLLQLVRDHMNRRTGAREAEVAAAPAVERETPVRFDEPVAVASATEMRGVDAIAAPPIPSRASPLPSTPAAMPAVDLSASLDARVVDMGVSGQWIDGLARDIAGLSAQGAQGRFRIDADRLGPVQVDIRQGSDGAAVSLTVASEMAETLLNQDSDRLRRDAGLSGVRIADVKVERATHVAEPARADSSGQSSGQQSSSQGQSSAWQGAEQTGGQSLGQSQSQGRWQARENNGPEHKAGGDPAVLNHVEASDATGEARRARYA